MIKEININEIIKLLSDNNISFSELKTYDEDLESIFPQNDFKFK